jgi:hypothetical protein
MPGSPIFLSGPFSSQVICANFVGFVVLTDHAKYLSCPNPSMLCPDKVTNPVLSGPFRPAHVIGPILLNFGSQVVWGGGTVTVTVAGGSGGRAQ